MPIKKRLPALLTAVLTAAFVFAGCSQKNTGDYYAELGMARNDEQDYLGAIENYQKALTLKLKDTSPAELHLYIGNAYYRLEDYDNSLISFEKCVEESPDYFKGWEGLGLVYSKTGDESAAEEAYLKALELDPENAGSISLYINLSFLYLSDNKAVSALEILEKAEAICPEMSSEERADPNLSGRRETTSTIYAYKALAYSALNRHSEAEYELSRAESHGYDFIGEIRERLDNNR